MKERTKKIELVIPNYQYCIQMTDDNNNSFCWYNKIFV